MPLIETGKKKLSLLNETSMESGFILEDTDLKKNFLVKNICDINVPYYKFSMQLVE